MPSKQPVKGLSKSANRKAKRSKDLKLMVKSPATTASVEEKSDAVTDFWTSASPRSNGLRIARSRVGPSGALFVEAVDKATFERLKASGVIKDASFSVVIECIVLQNPSAWGNLSSEEVRKGLKALFKVGPRRPQRHLSG